MSRDVFIIRAHPFSLDEIKRAYEAVGAETSGDLEYLGVQNSSGRFYINVAPTDEPLSAWQFFEDRERSEVVAIVGEPNWLLTITSGSLDVLNFAVGAFPISEPAAVENDNGLVLPLEIAQQRASEGVQWLVTDR